MTAPLSVHFANPATAGALRGRGMVAESRGAIESEDALFSRLAQALEFADSFGHNWESLDQSLRDVPGDVTLLVHEAEALFREAPDVAFRLIEVWLDVAAERQGEMHLVFVWS